GIPELPGAAHRQSPQSATPRRSRWTPDPEADMARRVRQGDALPARARSRSAPTPRPGCRRLVAVGPAAMVVAVLVGTWVAHALEYLRTWGPGQFGGAVTGSTHAYLGPVGVALVVTAAVATYWTRVLAERLEGNLAVLR